MCISETWLNHTTTDQLNIPGYSLVRNDRGLIYTHSNKDTLGGGVAAYVHESFKITPVFRSRVQSMSETEFLAIQITHNINSISILIIIVYRPPTSRDLNKVFDMLAWRRKNFSNIIIVGDFNAHLESENNLSDEFHEFITASKLFLVPSLPTYHRLNNHSWLDAMVVDDKDKLLSFNQSEVPFIDNDDCLMIKYKLEIPVVTRKSFRIRDFRRTDKNALGEEIRNVSVAHARKLSDDVDLNVALSNFTNSINSILDIHAPFIQVFPRKSNTPWLDKSYFVKARCRDLYYKKFKKTKMRVYKILYGDARKILRKERRRLRAQYFRKQFAKVTSTKEMWNSLQCLGFYKTKNYSNLATNFFSPTALTKFFAETYSIHPACSQAELQQIINDRPIDPTKPIFSFKSPDLDVTIKALNRAAHNSKGKSLDGFILKYISDGLHFASLFSISFLSF